VSDLCSLVLSLDVRGDLKNLIQGLLFIFLKMKKSLVYLKKGSSELDCFVSVEELLQ